MARDVFQRVIDEVREEVVEDLIVKEIWAEE
jgi:hypothetical protein